MLRRIINWLRLTLKRVRTIAFPWRGSRSQKNLIDNPAFKVDWDGWAKGGPVVGPILFETEGCVLTVKEKDED